MKRSIAAVIIALALTGGIAPTVHAAPAPATGISTIVAAGSPRPGQFCARADRGTTVNSSYGRLQCKADPKNDRYSRWYRV